MITIHSNGYRLYGYWKKNENNINANYDIYVLSLRDYDSGGIGEIFVKKIRENKFLISFFGNISEIQNIYYKIYPIYPIFITAEEAKDHATQFLTRIQQLKHFK